MTLAFDGAPVTLADDAFTRDSVLTVERRTPAGPQGRAATGRTLDEPVRLRLVLYGARCELVREAMGVVFRCATLRAYPSTRRASSTALTLPGASRPAR